MLDRPVGLVLTRLVGASLALITSPVIARAIGPEGRGLTAAAITTLMIVPIALGLGLPWAVRQKVAGAQDVFMVMRSARLLSFLSLLPAVPLGAVLAVTLFSGMPQSALVWLMAGLLVTPFVVQRNSAVSFFVVGREFRRISIVNIAQPIFFFISIIALGVLGNLTVTTVVASQTISMALACLTTMSLVKVPWRGARFPIRALARESLLASGAQISEIASYRLNQLILLPVIGSAALGYYAVAVNVALAPAPIGQAISSSTFSEFARASGDERHKKVADSLQSCCYLAIVVALVIAVLSPLLIPLAFGQEFRPAVLATIIMSAGLVFVICNFLLTSALVADGRSGAASNAQLVGFAGGTVMLFVLAFPFGLVGAAIASTIGFALTSVYSSWALSLGPRDWLPRRGVQKRAIRILMTRGAG
ncbi:oligosaccharide flippase family protein [Rhodococcus pyridinivorans]|nr:oligosaccharide flippase family protein [Rhodococcus pyridinivorans]